MTRFRSRSAAETEKRGYALGRSLKPGDAVALVGDLGSGKTTFIKGIVRALAPRAAVTSPTFVLMHEYKGKRKVTHMDWYRLPAAKVRHKAPADSSTMRRGGFANALWRTSAARPALQRSDARLWRTDAGMVLECLDAKGIALVEWADRAPALLPRGHIRVELRHAGGNVRDISISRLR